MDLKNLENIDRNCIWHPFTQMKEYEQETPLIVERGRGVYLFDIHGRKYLDGVSSLWVSVHGHCRPEIDSAVKKQLGKVAHSTLLGLSNVPAVEFAAELLKTVPRNLKKIFYSDSGSTAVEIALKIAFQYWQQKDPKFKSKKKFIALRDAYHGDTIGAVSVGGIDLFHQIYHPLLFDSYKAMAPHCYRCPHNKDPRAESGSVRVGRKPASCHWECVSKAESIIKTNHRNIAGFVIEPLVQGAAGIYVHPKGYLKRIRELCTKYDILMIVDEVATGFGRTGKMFACEHEAVRPDILALAKGISGGYLPLAATLATQEIYDAFCGKFEEMKTFFHGHTYTGNPLACAAGIASLGIFEKEKLIQSIQPKIKHLHKRLKTFYDIPSVGDIRFRGLMGGIELVFDREKGKPFPFQERRGHRVVLAARKRGLIIRPLGDVIVVMPPLSISIREIDIMVDILFESIEVSTIN